MRKELGLLSLHNEEGGKTVLLSPSSSNTTNNQSSNNNNNNNKQRQERNAIAEESLARFPPRRDRTKLLPLDRSRGCGLPEMPRNQLINRERVKQLDASLGRVERGGEQFKNTNNNNGAGSNLLLETAAFQSTNRQVYNSMNVTNAAVPSRTQTVMQQLGQRGGAGAGAGGESFGRKPMIKNSFFRKIGGNFLKES